MYRKLGAIPLRRVGAVLFYRGPKVVVRFRDGATVALPSAPFLSLGLERGSLFTLVTIREAGKIADVRVEAIRPPGQKLPRMGTPYVQVKRGRAVITRR